MKTLKNLGLLLLIMSISILYTNCAKDKCESIICENDGICEEGICACPTGYLGTTCNEIDTNKIQVLLDDGVTPQSLYDDGVDLEQLYGKMYEGGLIFYLDTINGTGMVAATENQSTGAAWGCSGELLGITGRYIGDGAQNTINIVSNCSEIGIAARLCDELNLNGKDDWFLPSQDELNLIYTNLHLKGYGGFLDDPFWSSTEFPLLSSAMYQHFSTGVMNNAFKVNLGNVRAARVF